MAQKDLNAHPDENNEIIKLLSELVNKDNNNLSKEEILDLLNKSIAEVVENKVKNVPEDEYIRKSEYARKALKKVTKHVVIHKVFDYVEENWNSLDEYSKASIQKAKEYLSIFFE